MDPEKHPSLKVNNIGCYTFRHSWQFLFSFIKRIFKSHITLHRDIGTNTVLVRKCHLNVLTAVTLQHLSSSK